MANIPLTAMGYDKVLTTPLDVTVGGMNIHVFADDLDCHQG